MPRKLWRRSSTKNKTHRPNAKQFWHLVCSDRHLSILDVTQELILDKYWDKFQNMICASRCNFALLCCSSCVSITAVLILLPPFGSGPKTGTGVAWVSSFDWVPDTVASRSDSTPTGQRWPVFCSSSTMSVGAQNTKHHQTWKMLPLVSSLDCMGTCYKLQNPKTAMDCVAAFCQVSSSNGAQCGLLLCDLGETVYTFTTLQKNCFRDINKGQSRDWR
jgi:hypothetical protein